VHSNALKSLLVFMGHYRDSGKRDFGAIWKVRMLFVMLVGSWQFRENIWAWLHALSEVLSEAMNSKSLYFLYTWLWR